MPLGAERRQSGSSITMRCSRGRLWRRCLNWQRPTQRSASGVPTSRMGVGGKGRIAWMAGSAGGFGRVRSPRPQGVGSSPPGKPSVVRRSWCLVRPGKRSAHGPRGTFCTGKMPPGAAGPTRWVFPSCSASFASPTGVPARWGSAAPFRPSIARGIACCCIVNFIPRAAWSGSGSRCTSSRCGFSKDVQGCCAPHGMVSGPPIVGSVSGIPGTEVR